MHTLVPRPPEASRHARCFRCCGRGHGSLLVAERLACAAPGSNLVDVFTLRRQRPVIGHDRSLRVACGLMRILKDVHHQHSVIGVR
jgi:hypothetical protein